MAAIKKRCFDTSRSRLAGVGFEPKPTFLVCEGSFTRIVTVEERLQSDDPQDTLHAYFDGSTALGRLHRHPSAG